MPKLKLPKFFSRKKKETTVEEITPSEEQDQVLEVAIVIEA